MKAAVVSLPPHLEGLERYEAGMSLDEFERSSGLARVYKLASNENPLGPSPKALAAAALALQRIHLYPDGPGTKLREAIAARLGVSGSQVAIGNGSTDLIDLLARSFLGPDDEGLTGSAAFARFRQCVAARNHHARLVPMKDHGLDVEALAAAITPRTRLLFLPNPNNPTGTWNTAAEVDALLARLPAGALLILDEAYREFAEEQPGYPDGLALVKAGAPVVVLRTFSKAYGLAGLRVGYAIAAPEVVSAIDTVREPFNTNLVGQAAALAALEDEAHLRATIALNRAERTRVAAALAARGLRVLPSLANFLCVETSPRAGADVFKALLAHGVIVRPLGPYGMPGFLRVSIGNADENTAFLAALDKVVAG